MSKLKINKLTIMTSQGKEVELSLEEANELFVQLKELFGEKTVYIPSTPIIIDRYPRPWWTDPWITYTTSDSSVELVSENTGMTVKYSE